MVRYVPGYIPSTIQKHSQEEKKSQPKKNDATSALEATPFLLSPLWHHTQHIALSCVQIVIRDQRLCCFVSSKRSSPCTRQKSQNARPSVLPTAARAKATCCTGPIRQVAYSRPVFWSCHPWIRTSAVGCHVLFVILICFPGAETVHLISLVYTCTQVQSRPLHATPNRIRAPCGDMVGRFRGFDDSDSAMLLQGYY